MTIKDRLALWRKRRHEADDRITRLNQRIKTRLARVAARPALAAYLAREFGLRFTSGWRSVAHNAAVGGVPGSWHTRGTRTKPGAVDLVGPIDKMLPALAWARAHVPDLAEAMIHDVGSGQHLHLAGTGVMNWQLPRRGVLKGYRQRRAEQRRKRAEADRKIRELKAQQRKISAQGAALVASFEGGQASDGLFHPYRDPVGVWTQGYGHTRGVSAASVPWSKARAVRVLRTDLNDVYAPHVRRLGLPLSQAQFDALTSFVFNLGPGAIGPDTGIGRALRARDWQRAGDEMLKWNRAGGKVLPGLTARRQRERALFLSI